jgi:NADH dehydrogenase (ubiquinone) 1 alpha subcomplex subunit 5
MLRRAVQLLPSSLRALSQPTLQRGFADLNLQDPETFKKFVGIEEALGVVADPRAELKGLLEQLLDRLQEIPDSSDYRRVTEATTQYRLKVLEQNDSNQAVEEVLDAHMEELMLETREEMALVPMMSSKCLCTCCMRLGTVLQLWGDKPQLLLMRDLAM